MTKTMENKQVVEVIYPKAKISKRVVAFIIDFLIIIFTAFLFFSLENLAFRNTELYKNNAQIMNDVKLESGLYIKDESNSLITIVSYTDNQSEMTIIEKKDYLSSHIDNFYINKKFFDNDNYLKEYENRKNNYQVSGEFIFEKSGEKYVEKLGVDPNAFYTFYKSEINDNCLGYLNLNVDYTNAQRFNFISYIVMFVIGLFLSFAIYVLLLPLTAFKRGRQTLGMKIMKIAYISLEALNVKSGKYVGRFFFSFLTYFILNFIAFLIPLIVSISMMALSKTSQTLNEYVFNDYVVDVSNCDIYLDYFDYTNSREKSQNTTLKNIDLNVRR